MPVEDNNLQNRSKVGAISLLGILICTRVDFHNVQLGASLKLLLDGVLPSLLRDRLATNLKHHCDSVESDKGKYTWPRNDVQGINGELFTDNVHPA